MRQVNPRIYRGISRAERRRIAKDLAKAKERHNEAFEEARRLRSLFQVAPSPLGAIGIGRISQDGELLETLAREIEARNAQPPICLLACANCHRPTSQCICLDGDGNPLVWN